MKDMPRGAYLDCFARQSEGHREHEDVAWVKRRHRPATGLGLLYPQERTSATADAMSALGHERTFMQCLGCAHASKTNRVPVYERKSFVGIAARAVS